MKKLLVLTMVAVLVFSFALSAASAGGPPCDKHQCYIDSGCEDGVCWYIKCCRDQYINSAGKCVWGDYICASLL